MIIMEEVTVQKTDIMIEMPRKSHTYSMRFGMAFATEDNKQVASFTACRDFLHDQIRTFLNDKKRISDDGHPYYPEAGDPDIDMSRLRLVFMLEHSDFSKVVHAVRVLNSFEKAADMELSTVKQVQVKDSDGESYFILLEGSGEYMHNPHLLSLLTLTMRFCYYNDTFKVVDENSLTKSYAKICPLKDRTLMKPCHKLLPHILKRREELFRDKSLEELFPAEIKYRFHGKGGIQQLCQENSNNSDVNDRIYSLKKELKIE